MPGQKALLKLSKTNVEVTLINPPPPPPPDLVLRFGLMEGEGSQ